MSKWITLILVGAAFGVGVGVGVAGILWATGGDSEPSREISEVVPTLSLDAPTPTPAVSLNELSTKIDTLSTQVAVLSEAVARGQMMPAATEAAADSTPEANSAAPVEGERALFRISQEDSEARFLIEEVLMGNPTTVVGATRQVAGDIIIDYSNPSASTIGQIGVNARTLKTDNEFRDQSIRGQILESSKAEYEFITFEPTEVMGLSAEPIAVGSTVEFQVRGNLKIREVTREVVFDLTVTAVSETHLEGLARTTVRYEDFDISIKAPPSVSNIGEEVTLELEFVALRVEEG